jgi:hypothetical protein
VREPLAHVSPSETSCARDTVRPHTVNEAEEEAVLTSDMQYRPVRFACTVRWHEGMRTVPAGKDKKNRNKWPQSLQHTLNKG